MEIGNLENKNRIVWITDETLRSEEEAQTIIKELINFDLDNSDRPICIFVNSIGGKTLLMEQIRAVILDNLSSPIITIAVNRVQSATCPLFACGHVRVALKNASFLFHGSLVEYTLSGDSIKFNELTLTRLIDRITDRNKKLFELYTFKRPEHANTCKLDSTDLEDLIKKSHECEYIISAEEAKKFGFVDEIIQTPAELGNVKKDVMKIFENKKQKKE